MDYFKAGSKWFRNVVVILALFGAMDGTGTKLYSQVGEPRSQEAAVRVFLDRFSDIDHIRQEIPFLNYVRDTREAQVYLLLTRQTTGGGGSENTITFVGQEEFTGVNDTLSYVTIQSQTQEETRRAMIKALKMGMMRYVSKTPFSEDITISYTRKTEGQSTLPEDDKWDYWVFRLGMNAFLNGEESFKNTIIFGNFSASRITEDWKIRFSYNSSYNESNFETGTVTVNNFSRNHNFSSLIVKSLSDHWSAGFQGSASSSTFNNTSLSTGIFPAIEYNYFTYEESTRHQLRFLYKIGGRNVRYREETIFDKTSETLLYTSLAINTSIIEKWGSVNFSLEGIVYFHDPEINRLNLNGSLNFRIIKGLSLNLSGFVSLVHDQLFLPKGDRSIDEILLRRTQLKTNWNYFTSFGFNYSFGSLYNNVVNPRFGR